MSKDQEGEVVDLTGLVEEGRGDDATRVYEVGYHLAPTISEDELAGVAAGLTDAVRAQVGEVVGERAPHKVSLAYAIEKVIDGAKRVFDEAHFGWIAFEASVQTLPAIEQLFKAHPQVLRFIVLKTERDSVAATLADPTLDVLKADEEMPLDEVVSSVSDEAVVESVGADPE